MFRGIYRIYETYGLPVSDMLNGLEDKGLVPDWLHLFFESKMKPDRFVSFYKEGILDSRIKNKEQIISRLVLMVEQLKTVGRVV